MMPALETWSSRMKSHVRTSSSPLIYDLYVLTRHPGVSIDKTYEKHFVAPFISLPENLEKDITPSSPLYERNFIVLFSRSP